MAAAIMTVLKKRRKSWLTLTRTPEERAAMLRGVDGPAYLKQAMLEKRGPRIGSAWNQRWVKLSNSQIEYGYYEESTNTPGATIESIPIWQVEVCASNAFVKLDDLAFSQKPLLTHRQPLTFCSVLLPFIRAIFSFRNDPF